LFRGKQEGRMEIILEDPNLLVGLRIIKILGKQKLLKVWMRMMLWQLGTADFISSNNLNII
jgi:hypothetical protein